MKIQFVAITGLLLAVVIHAARKEHAGKRARRVMPLRREQEQLTTGKKLNRKKPAKWLETKKDLHQILSADDRYDFQIVKTMRTAQNTMKRRMKVTWDNLEVIGANIQASYDETNGYTGSLTGQFVSGIEKDITSSYDCQCEDNALFSIGKKEFDLPEECEHCRLVKTKKKVFVDKDSTARLIYTIDIDNNVPKNPQKPFLIVDACTMKIHVKFDQIHNYSRPFYASNTKLKRHNFRPSALQKRTAVIQNRTSHLQKRPAGCSMSAAGTGGNPKTGAFSFGTPPFCLDVTMSGPNCVLENANVKVVDLHQSTSKVGQPAYEYDCIESYDNINGGNSANLDAFFFGNVLYSIFQTQFGVNALDSQLLIYTHYANRYENAFWDGVSLTFGDGDGLFYPLVCLDVVTHEVAHCITTDNSNLFYSGESGGMNEAFSDIAGDTIEYLAQHNYYGNDWMVGYDIIKSTEWALRYFDVPNLDGRSIDHISKYYDGLDVHYSSGLFNRAFYEMVVTQGIPIEYAFQCFLIANMLYWYSDSSFVEGACGVQAAALDLGISTSKIQAAFSVVGIDSSSCDMVDSLETLQPGRTQVTVSSTVSPCFLLMEYASYRRDVYIYASSSNRISITVQQGLNGPVFATRTNAIRVFLPSNEDLVVCFSASSSATVYLDTYYCCPWFCVY